MYNSRYSSFIYPDNVYQVLETNVPQSEENTHITNPNGNIRKVLFGNHPKSNIRTRGGGAKQDNRKSQDEHTLKLHRECSFKCFLWKVDATKRIKRKIVIASLLYVIAIFLVYYTSYCHIPNVDDTLVNFCKKCDQSHCYEDVKTKFLLPVDQKEKCSRELKAYEEKKRVMDLIEKENIPSFRRFLPKSLVIPLYILVTLFYILFIPHVYFEEQKEREGHIDH